MKQQVFTMYKLVLGQGSTKYTKYTFEANVYATRKGRTGGISRTPDIVEDLRYVAPEFAKAFHSKYAYSNELPSPQYKTLRERYADRYLEQTHVHPYGSGAIAYYVIKGEVVSEERDTLILLQMNKDTLEHQERVRQKMRKEMQELVAKDQKITESIAQLTGNMPVLTY